MGGPLSRELSDRSVDEEILLRQGKHLQQQQQHVGRGSASTALAAGKAAMGGAGGGPSNTKNKNGREDIGLDHGGVAADGLERVRLDAERQILLTMLLAHMCASNDATPRTFVEQVGVSMIGRVLLHCIHTECVRSF